MPVLSGSPDRPRVLAPTALAAHVEGRHRVAAANPTELPREVSAAARVTVKFEQRRAPPAALPRTQVLRMKARSAHAGEVEVKALGERCLERSRDEFDIRLDLLELVECTLPVRVEVLGTRVPALIALELVERQ